MDSDQSPDGIGAVVWAQDPAAASYAETPRMCAQCGKPRGDEVHWPFEYVGEGGHDFVPPDKCWGELVLTDSCYGMTGGRRYDCLKCGSYFVTTSPDDHPTRCTFQPAASSATIAGHFAATVKTLLDENDRLAAAHRELLAENAQLTRQVRLLEHELSRMHAERDTAAWQQDAIDHPDPDHV